MENHSFANNSEWFPVAEYPFLKNDIFKYHILAHITLGLLVFLLTKILNFQTKATNFLNREKRKKPSFVVAYNYRLLNFPFPVFWLIDGFLTLNNLRKDGVKYLETMVKRFGKLAYIRIGFIKALAVTDPDVVQKVLTSTDFRHLNKPRPIYDFIFMDFLRNGLVSADTELWAPHRKIMSRSFTYKALCSYVNFMNAHSRNLVMDLLQSLQIPGEAEGSDAVDCVTGAEMYDMIYFHTIKIISEIAMGSDYCTAEEASNFHKSTSVWKELLIRRFLNPILLIAPIWWLHPMKRDFDKAGNELTTFMNTVINRYRIKRQLELEAEGNSATDEVKTVAEENETKTVEEKPVRCLIEEMICSNATDKEILEEFATIMLAGHESVATATRMLMFNLALNPEHQSACRQEVDRIFESKGATDNTEQQLTMDDLNNMKYVERCILESGRLTSTFPLFLRRLDAPLKIDDNYQLDEGTNIVFVAWCLHRDPNTFPNPEKFDPDRFLPDNIKQRHPYVFIPFSGGPRICLGWKVAIMELKCIIAWILRYFEIFTSDGPDDVKLLFEVTLLPERPHKITLKRRQK